MKTILNAAAEIVVAAALAFPPAVQETGRPAVENWRVVEVAAAVNGADESCLARPVALAVDKESVYIIDAQDCALKIFSRDGGFLKAAGRKGRGPGDFSFPAGVSVHRGRIFVADKFNFRTQVLDGEGRPAGGFSLPFAPDKIFALDSETLLVTSNPTGRPVAEKLLHIYDARGRLRWEGLEARSSSDPVFDTFMNMILVCPGAAGDFFVVFRSGERSILHFTGSGALAGRIPVDERHAFRPVNLPFPGPQKRLLGFCWAAAWDRELFYLLAPAPVEGRDLGPGKRLSVIDRNGRLTAAIDLPCPVHRFVIDGTRVFAIDDEGELRIFEVVR